MRKILFSVMTVVLLLCLVSCGSSLPKHKEYRILMIGNSFTYGNMLPTILQKTLEDAGYKKVTVDAVMVGQYNLSKYLNPEDPHYGDIEKYLDNYKYDYVIIQEASIRPLNQYESFRSAASTIVDMARANGAEVLFYETWGYKTGHPDLRNNGWTTADMAYGLARAYKKLGEELNVDVVYCGLEVQELFEQYPDMPLYLPDLRHPAIGTSYLVALSFANRIFGIDVTKVKYNPGPSTISEEQAVIIRQEVMDFSKRPLTIPAK